PRAGRLYWALWLTQTERAAEAVKFLEDPVNFPGEKDARYKRVLARALFGAGDREAGAELLRQQPHDPAIDAALLQLAVTPEAQRKELAKAMANHENKGLFVVW